MRLARDEGRDGTLGGEVVLVPVDSSSGGRLASRSAGLRERAASVMSDEKPGQPSRRQGREWTEVRTAIRRRAGQVLGEGESAASVIRAGGCWMSERERRTGAGGGKGEGRWSG